MHHDRVAEWILSLVSAPDRAVSVVGDLLEEAVVRGPLWFWMCVAQRTLALLWHNLTETPFRMAGWGAFGWFVYMLLSVVLWFGGFVFVTLLWGMGYFFTHHTGLELLASALKIRFDWPPPPKGVMHWSELFLMCTAAPFQVGRITARYWPGRELAAWVIMSLVWPFMAVLVPFVAMSTRVSLPMIPVIQAFVLLGALWARRESMPAADLSPR